MTTSRGPAAKRTTAASPSCSTGSSSTAASSSRARHASRTPRAPATRLGDALTGCCDAFGHIANDVLTLGRPEIGELGEPAVTGRGGSSTMPHKANPVLAVLIRRAALAAPGLAAQLHLAAADTRPGRLASTAVGSDFLSRQMADSRAERIVLLLDCCYGGAFPRGMVVRADTEAQVLEAFAAQSEVAGGKGRAVVTASSAMEYSFEEGDLTPSSSGSPSSFACRSSEARPRRAATSTPLPVARTCIGTGRPATGCDDGRAVTSPVPAR